MTATRTRDAGSLPPKRSASIRSIPVGVACVDGGTPVACPGWSATLRSGTTIWWTGPS
jgi:hypothetical protein